MYYIHHHIYIYIYIYIYLSHTQRIDMLRSKVAFFFARRLSKPRWSKPCKKRKTLPFFVFFFFFFFFFFHNSTRRQKNDDDGKIIRWRSVVLLGGSLVRSVLPSSFSFRLSRRRLSLCGKKDDFVETLKGAQKCAVVPSGVFTLGRVRPRLGYQFTLANRPFTFAGWNHWEVVEASSNAPPPYRWTPKFGIEPRGNTARSAVNRRRA